MKDALTFTLIGLLCALGLHACNDFPRDPEETLENVRQSRKIEVGLIESEEWATASSGEPHGVEVELVRKLADELDAEPRWTRGTERELMEMLKHFKLDLVVGGLTKNSKWKNEIAFSTPHATSIDRLGEKQEHVLASPPGENRWLARVNKFIRAHEKKLRRRASQ